MEHTDLTTKPISKVTKKEGYRTIRIPVNVSREELSRYLAMAQEAGYASKLQKATSIRKDTGKETPNIKGISKWLRDCVVPDYVSHAWQREQQRAEAMRKREEAEAELKRLGGGLKP